MKITATDFATLADAITPQDTETVRATYRAGDFPRADRVKDLNKRYRWDLLHAAGGWRLTTALYKAGASDAHIDTALRRIVPAL
jgi:hypothetical protein